LELSRLVKKAMKNKCWKERGTKHTHLDKWTCASGKWMIPRHEWSPRYRIAHGWKIWVWMCHQGTWELMKQKRTEEHLYFFSLFYFLLIFLSLFFSLYSSYFSYFSFLLIIFFHFSFLFFFSFAPQNFLQHNTYIAFV
jgi:hypothetical protein